MGLINLSLRPKASVLISSKKYFLTTYNLINPQRYTPYLCELTPYVVKSCWFLITPWLPLCLLQTMVLYNSKEMYEG